LIPVQSLLHTRKLLVRVSLSFSIKSQPIIRAPLPYQSKSFGWREFMTTCMTSLPNWKYGANTSVSPPQFLNQSIPS
jgi:hypothetical protein